MDEDGLSPAARRPVVVLPWLLFIVALAVAVWGLWRAYGTAEPGDPLATTLTAFERQNRLTIFSAQLSPVVASDEEALFGMLKSRQVAVIPSRVDYTIDLSVMDRKRLSWHGEAQRLDVRLPGLEDWSPRRALLTRGDAVDGWEILANPQDVYRLHDVNDLLVEGGSATATAFLTADLVDRIIIYRAPIIVGEGKSSFGYVGLDAIADAHGRWRTSDGRSLGIDRLEVYERIREA